jgi:hypothetical protein
MSAELPGDSRTMPDELELACLREQFPGFRIWREETWGRAKYIARRQQAGLNPHTVVTGDLGELRAALGAAPAPPGRPCPGAPTSQGSTTGGSAARTTTKPTATPPTRSRHSSPKSLSSPPPRLYP